MSFADANNGWVAGAGGAVRHTTNGSNAGGSTWAAQTSGSDPDPVRPLFTDASNGWVVGGAGTVRHTTNSGTAWATQTSGVTVALYGTTFTDLNHGWTVGAGGGIRYTTNGGTAWTAQTSSVTQALRGIVFAAGSLWACGGNGVVLTYLVDTTPPATTATGLQASNNTGWRTTGQAVTLAATDSQSGVNATYYTIDGGAQQTYAAPFTVSAQGSHTIVYWSVDKAGNTETKHTGYVNVDTAAPTTTAAGLQMSNSTGWRTTSQTVTLTATDALSGVSATYYTVDGGAQQTYTAAFTVSRPGLARRRLLVGRQGGERRDQSHRLREHRHHGANHDGDGPAGERLIGLAERESGGESGRRRSLFRCGGHLLHPRRRRSSDLHRAVHRVRPGLARRRLLVGRRRRQHRDVEDRLRQHRPGGADCRQRRRFELAQQPVTVHLSPADAGGSGLAGTQYRLQGSSTWLAAAGNAFVVPAPTDGSGDGLRVYQYRALDNAGNSSATGTCTVWIDASAPVTTATGLAADQYSSWRTTSQTVTLSADDGMGSGVTQIYYTVDGGLRQTYSVCVRRLGHGPARSDLLGRPTSPATSRRRTPGG